jgi:hypothetical protein
MLFDKFSALCWLCGGFLYQCLDVADDFVEGFVVLEEAYGGFLLSIFLQGERSPWPSGITVKAWGNLAMIFLNLLNGMPMEACATVCSQPLERLAAFVIFHP